jgi:hypothetical protein
MGRKTVTLNGVQKFLWIALGNLIVSLNFVRNFVAGKETARLTLHPLQNKVI